MAPKRKCHFRDEFSVTWSFIKKGRNEFEAYCTFCKSYLQVDHGGKSDIVDHIKCNKHKKNSQSVNISEKVTKFFVTPDTKEEKLVAAAELVNVYKVIFHHNSFNSLDCTTPLYSKLFPDSKIACKMSTARTKGTAIVKYILAPHTVDIFKSDLENTIFFSLATDASNHKSEKIFPIIIQYFTKSDGTKSQLIKMSSLKNETSETISQYCIDTLNNLKIPLKKCIAFCADNANTNFGGIHRKGQNNIFFKLKEAIQNELEGVGCSAHILHNTISTAANTFSFDAEMIIFKIFGYFSIYTVRTEKLKDFCEFVDINYRTILNHSKTRWVSLLPAVERTLSMWPALKSFFQSEEKPPKILLDTFNSPMSETYMWFLHAQLVIFNRNILLIEKSKTSIIELRKILSTISDNLKNRQINKFVGLKVLEMLRKEEISDQVKHTFYEEVDEFYNTAITYLTKWSVSTNHFHVFDWMSLLEPIAWRDVEETIIYLSDKNIQLDDSLLFDQLTYLKKKIEEFKNSILDWDNKIASEKWQCFFSVSIHDEQHSELLKIAQYVFAIPAHNANVERVFSLMEIQWTDERNRLQLDTVESIIMCKYNYKKTCSEFYEYVKTQPSLLTSVKSSKKCEWYKENETEEPSHPGPSTSK